MWKKILEFLRWVSGALGKKEPETPPLCTAKPDTPSGLSGLLRYPVPKFDVQKFLESKKSGLAQVSFEVKGQRFTAAQWIEKIAEVFNIKPQWILMTLQAEQGLVTYPTPLDANYQIQSLPYKGLTKPPAPEGFRAIRNGGKFGTAKVKDGNMWFLAKGPWKMIAAAGAGIPDPKIFPPWDVRKYIGFANQVYWVGALAHKYQKEYADSIKEQDPGKRSVYLYTGETVVADDPESLALLRYTPNLAVLTQRPSVYRSLFG